MAATHNPCKCPTCRHTDAFNTIKTALASLDDAANDWLERDAEMEGVGRHIADTAGELLDAMRDEMRLAVGENRHVLEHVTRLAKVLGGAYERDYLEGWD